MKNSACYFYAVLSHALGASRFRRTLNNIIDDKTPAPWAYDAYRMETRSCFAAPASKF